eukprot:g47283.t1
MLHLICFILDHYVFTFNNQFFIQTHGTAMRTKFSPQYANIFLHKFEQDFFADGHLSTSLYHKPMGNLTMLHFSNFHPKHVKETVPYSQALRICRICSEEEEREGHLKILKDALIRMGYDAQLINHQFQCVTAKNRNNVLRRQTQDMTDKVPLVIQYFSGAERLCQFFTAFNMSPMTMSISLRSSYTSTSHLQTTAEPYTDHRSQQTTQSSGQHRPQHHTTLPWQPLQDM